MQALRYESHDEIMSVAPMDGTGGGTRHPDATDGSSSSEAATTAAAAAQLASTGEADSAAPSRPPKHISLAPGGPGSQNIPWKVRI